VPVCRSQRSRAQLDRIVLLVLVAIRVVVPVAQALVDLPRYFESRYFESSYFG